MTAADVIYSLQRFKDKGYRKSDLAGIDTMEAPDPYTVRITLKAPDGTFLFSLANPVGTVMIMPKGLAEEQGGTITHPVGTGPYQFVEWARDRYIVLKRFAAYKPWPEKSSGFAGAKVPYADEVRFIPIKDESVRGNALATGDVDIADGLGYPTYSRLKNASGLKVFDVPSFTITEMRFGHKQSLMANRALRQAVAYAIDKKQLADGVTYGLGRPAPSIVLPGSALYDSFTSKDARIEGYIPSYMQFPGADKWHYRDITLGSAPPASWTGPRRSRRPGRTACPSTRPRKRAGLSTSGSSVSWSNWSGGFGRAPICRGAIVTRRRRRSRSRSSSEFAETPRTLLLFVALVVAPRLLPVAAALHVAPAAAVVAAGVHEQPVARRAFALVNPAALVVGREDVHRRTKHRPQHAVRRGVAGPRPDAALRGHVDPYVREGSAKRRVEDLHVFRPLRAALRGAAEDPEERFPQRYGDGQGARGFVGLALCEFLEMLGLAVAQHAGLAAPRHEIVIAVKTFLRARPRPADRVYEVQAQPPARKIEDVLSYCRPPDVSLTLRHITLY